MSTVGQESRDSRDDEGRVPEPDPRRWTALAVLAAMQFMLVLDVTVVTVALPRIRDDLSFSPQGLAWVVNGYVLMAGGLLLLGGRPADMFGRRRLFLTGVVVFGRRRLCAVRSPPRCWSPAGSCRASGKPWRPGRARDDPRAVP